MKVRAALKLDVTLIEFSPIQRHPNALWFVQKLNGEFIQQGAVTRSVIEAHENPHTLAHFLTEHRPYDEAPKGSKEASLPLNATFWPVPRKRLHDPEEDLWPKTEAEVTLENAENPDYVLIHKSGWDHQVWGVDREPIMAPLRLEIWGKHYHLRRLGEHLLKSPHFSDFEVVPNTCWQNHDISGRSLGHVTFDPTGFEFPKGVSRSISSCEEAFFRLPSYGDDDVYDPFGVRPFRTGAR